MKMFSKAVEKEAGIQTPVYKSIKVKELKVAEYQRDLSSQRSRKYARDFDYDVFGVPLVSYRDDNYWTVDGNHRIEALKILGVDRVFCQVLNGLTYEEEAEKFVKLNSERGGLTSNQKFHGRVESRDKAALDVVAILAKNGLAYAKNAGIKKDNVVGAVASLEGIYKTKGENLLNRTLCIIKNTWCGEPSSLQRDIILGVATFLSESRGVKDDILIQALEKTTPQQIILLALVFAGTSNNLSSVNCGGGLTRPHIAKVIRDKYCEEKKILKDKERNGEIYYGKM